MSIKPALITGGCGFVGRHLVKALLARSVPDIWIVDNLSTGRSPQEWLGPNWQENKDGNVHVFRKDAFTIHFVCADALSFFYNRASTDVSDTFPRQFSDIFHLASIVGGRALIDGDPLMVATDLGIDATFLLWLTRKPERAERVLYASSSAAYPTKLQGETGAQALTETGIDFTSDLGTPDMTYGWSKLTGEYLSKLAHERYGIHIACVRPFSGFGEDQDLTYPTPSIALRIARKDNPIEVWGTGEQGRDFVHIDDCVDAFFAILDHVDDGSGVNIGTGIVTSFNALISRMLALEGHDGVIKPLTDKPVGVSSRYADTARLFNEISWSPRISLDDGLKKVLEGAHARLEGSDLPFTIE